ncbi:MULTISPECIES: hypothetical protein [Streptomyces]|uniref:hypothetical protein n=1 Tax=Streptomyces TaxID=1883 RepID=UPI0004C5B665|nr:MULTISPECIES: hypothetical protein [Streptomyces]MDX2668429.1 hypothetical protein [Streptomyces sp. NRRL_ISP-5395]WKN18573.1 hypothetical protein NEH83_32915 [Streptomyces sp. JUS-F4]GHF49913.1 hypothetical protein GCM10010504_17440 [Streptomyces griseus]
MSFGRPGRRTRPREEPVTEEHMALGMIEDAIEDGPTEVQGPDTLIIRADVPTHGQLRRRVTCPLPIPGSGRGLVGRPVRFRHRTHDADDAGGVPLTMVMLIGVVVTSGELFAGLPEWFRPGAVLAASAGAAVLGPLVFAFSESRGAAALSRSGRGPKG